MTQKKTFEQWELTAPFPSARSAWNYQQIIINKLVRDYADEVCNGKEGLRAKIEELQAEVLKLKTELASYEQSHIGL